MPEFGFDKFIDDVVSHPDMVGKLTERRYKKGEYLFSQGEVCGDVFFLREGLIKMYFITLDGKEWIKSFVSDRGILGSRTSQSLGKASPFSALCLEESMLIRLPYSALEEVCFSDMSLARAVFHFTQWLGVRKEIREYQLLCLSEEDAYVEFVNANPGLIERITQIDIARYLGITPVGLSRIKKRLVED